MFTGCGMKASSSGSGNLRQTGILTRFTLIAITNMFGIIILVSRLLRLSRGLATPERIATEKLNNNYD